MRTMFFILCFCSGLYAGETSTIPVPDLIKNLQQDHSISVFYNQSDLLDENGKAYAITGDFEALDVHDAFRLISGICSVTVDRIGEKSYMIKPRSEGLEDMLVQTSGSIKELQTSIDKLQVAGDYISRDFRAMQKLLENLERRIRSIETDLLTR